MSEELAEMKTDIALIKADVKNIQRFFGKVETSIDMMSEISKNVAVQDEITKNAIDRLEDLEAYVKEHRTEDLERSRAMMERLESYRKMAHDDHQRLADHTASKRVEHNKQIIDELRSMKELMEKKLDAQDDKIQKLENWKYYLAGMGAVIIFLLAKAVDLPALFG